MTNAEKLREIWGELAKLKFTLETEEEAEDMLVKNYLYERVIEKIEEIVG